jgi:putative ABC transport system ATP-binding protein
MIDIRNPTEISENCTPLLEAQSLGRRRTIDGGWLLRDIQVVVDRGARVAVLGPSGGGKTLLLRALALLDVLDEGVVLWSGQVIRCEAVPSYRGAVLYLHQRPTLFEGNVETNLRHPFSLRVHRNRCFDRDRIIQLLEQLGRDVSFLEKLHRDLSGGEAQIVALVRALQLDPTVLLLDEPTASLDREAATVIEGLIRRWHADGAGRRAYVWVTHDSGQAERVADQILWMEAGRVGRGA